MNIIVKLQKGDKKDENKKKGGTPYRIRTCDLRYRKPMLYPAEPRVHMICKSGILSQMGLRGPLVVVSPRLRSFLKLNTIK